LARDGIISAVTESIEHADPYEVLLRVDDRVELHRLEDGSVEVSATAPDGRVTRGPRLGPDVDLSHAFRAASERWAELEPDASLAARVRRSLDYFGYEPINERDWDALLATHAPDGVIVDRRPASLGEVNGRDAWVDLQRSQVDMTPDAHWRTGMIHALAPGFGTLSEVIVSGSTPDGFEFERAVAAIYMHGNAGAVVRMEIFSEDDLDAARSRFAELVEDARRAFDVEGRRE
jgi:hypothetical protein